MVSEHNSPRRRWRDSWPTAPGAELHIPADIVRRKSNSIWAIDDQDVGTRCHAVSVKRVQLPQVNPISTLTRRGPTADSELMSDVPGLAQALGARGTRRFSQTRTKGRGWR